MVFPPRPTNRSTRPHDGPGASGNTTATSGSCRAPRGPTCRPTRSSMTCRSSSGSTASFSISPRRSRTEKISVWCPRRERCSPTRSRPGTGPLSGPSSGCASRRSAARPGSGSRFTGGIPRRPRAPTGPPSSALPMATWPSSTWTIQFRMRPDRSNRATTARAPLRESSARPGISLAARGCFAETRSQICRRDPPTTPHRPGSARRSPMAVSLAGGMRRRRGR